MNWKDFFYFSQRERRGILLLIVFLAGIFVGKLIFQSKNPESLESNHHPENQLITDSAMEQSPYVPLYQQPEYRQKQAYHPPKQPEKRTYYDRKNEEPPLPPQSQFPKTEKYTVGTVIELNAADTTELIKIPGVGPAFARRIVSYKNRLGGFHRIEQLQEVYGMYEELYIKIIPFLQIDNQLITPVPVNQSSLERLKMHPYINFYQAKAIVETRKKKGRIEKIDELKLLEEFSDNDWMRITPYLSFE
ncbi:MAG: helix-hairpin-helix domain-containing protein [Dysgonamonadaceae bacterium]|jgi:competence ComEA-like helix-hairpin-helix protein|nr:helix-hairpin-helix domain-containing protein [Dysgonamonadaceae bacterium]